MITKVAAGDAKDIETAVQAARAAFKSSWGLKVAGSQRGSLLEKLASLIESHMDELAALEAINAGKCLILCTGMLAQTSRIR